MSMLRDMYDFGAEFAQTYSDTCECGRLVEVSTQEDNCPEYYTTVFIRCQCGKSVGITVPVN